MSTKKKNIKWEPTEKQSEVLVRPEFEILFGGARGGGKTDSLMVWLLYWVTNPNYRALVIRKNADDLKDWVDRASRMYRDLGVVITGKPADIRFPSGAIIRTGHLNDENAFMKYQGHEYQKIGIEELTQIDSESSYEMLIQSCRSTVEGIEPQVFCTTNPQPGTAGHKWVMRRFINVAKPGEAYKDERSGLTRIFIPSRVEDNPYLMKKDPTYVKRLEAIEDDVLRKAWREGLWEDIDVEGAYYARWMRDVLNEGRVGYVPYDPKLLVYTAWDIGWNDATAIIFAQFYKKEIRIIDYLEINNTSLVEAIEMVLKKKYVYGGHYGPHDLNVHEYGTGVTRLSLATQLGFKFSVISRSGLDDGIEAVRLLLPRMFFDTDKTDRIRDCLFNYRQKWSSTANMFIGEADSEFNHGADAMRMLALGFREKGLITSSEFSVDIVPINYLSGI